MIVSVERRSHFDELDERSRRAWDTFPQPSPMQSRTWLSTWSEVFTDGERTEPCLVVVRRDDEPIGLAPWSITTSPLGVRRLGFLGDGLICSDHAAILAKPGCERPVVTALAAWLRRHVGTAWDVIQFESIDAGRSPAHELVASVADLSCLRLERPRPSCWTVDLPATVEEYFASLSKNHRKRCRRWRQEYFESGRASSFSWSAAPIEAGWNELDRLNRARRESLGDRSAFVDRRFQRFHRSVLPRLQAEGAVELRGLIVDGRPRAVEYLLKHGTTLSCYQSGMEPSGDDDVGSGNLSLLATFCGAIEAGYRRIDFLRGDEEYKRHWNAVPQPCADLYLASTSLAGRADALRMRTLDWARGLRHREAARPIAALAPA